MMHTKFQGHHLSVPEKKIFKDFYSTISGHGQDHMSKLSCPHPIEALTLIGPVVLRRRCLEIVDDDKL